MVERRLSGVPSVGNASFNGDLAANVGRAYKRNMYVGKAASLFLGTGHRRVHSLTPFPRPRMTTTVPRRLPMVYKVLTGRLCIPSTIRAVELYFFE